MRQLYPCLLQILIMAVLMCTGVMTSSCVHSSNQLLFDGQHLQYLTVTSWAWTQNAYGFAFVVNADGDAIVDRFYVFQTNSLETVFSAQLTESDVDQLFEAAKHISRLSPGTLILEGQVSIGPVVNIAVADKNDNWSTLCKMEGLGGMDPAPDEVKYLFSLIRSHLPPGELQVSAEGSGL